MNHSHWNLLPPAPETLVNASPYPPLVTRLLFHRGLTDIPQFDAFLADDIRLVGNPFLLPDMQRAVTRIYQALLSGEHIIIYGDYDADGVTATAVLVQGLSLLGGRVMPYIPHRVSEGYGLKSPALEKLSGEKVNLVITVDCGITAVAEVKKAKRLGLDIIVTDHHVPLPEIPPAVAVIDPKLPGCTYPFNELTGVGVAFKLLQALFQGMGREKELDALYDLVAMGTIADMAPLLGENRFMVKEGLKVINNTVRPGIREMLAQARVEDGGVDAECVSFVLAPRLNAAGRLDHAMSSFKLLMTSSPEEAHNLAVLLDQKNQERQALTTKFFARAREKVRAQGVAPLLIVGDEEYPSGIAGLVASRLVEEYYRPAIVMHVGEHTSSGSARSIPEFNIVMALQECQHLLMYFGGHAQAAGFTLSTSNLPAFQQALGELAASQLKDVDLRPHLDVEAEVNFKEMTPDVFRAIQKLAPFGRGNPLPVFLSRQVEVLDCRTMGSSGDHLRMRLRKNGIMRDGVAFRSGDCLGEIAPFMDIVYTMETDRWNGQEKLRLNMLDFAPCGKSSG